MLMQYLVCLKNQKKKFFLVSMATAWWQTVESIPRREAQTDVTRSNMKVRLSASVSHFNFELYRLPRPPLYLSNIHPNDLIFLY